MRIGAREGTQLRPFVGILQKYYFRQRGTRQHLHLVINSGVGTGKSKGGINIEGENQIEKEENEQVNKTEREKIWGRSW